jgi:hypothetical protein
MDKPSPISERIHEAARETFGRSITNENRDEYVTHWFDAAQTLFFELTFEGFNEQARQVEELIEFNRKFSMKKDFKNED